MEWNAKYLLKSHYWGKLIYSKLHFSKFVSRLVFEELQLTQISMNFQTSCCDLKIRSLAPKLCCDVLKSKNQCFLLNKNISFLTKTRQNRSLKSHTLSERWNLCCSSFKNRELKNCDELELEKEKKECIFCNVLHIL